MKEFNGFKSCRFVYQGKFLSEVPASERANELRRLIDEGILPKDYDVKALELNFTY